MRPHAVRKRTPRFPVSCSYKKGNEESYFSLNKVSLRSDMDTTDDEVAHVAALTLTEASLREGSHASQAPFRRTEHMKASHVQSRERMVVIHIFCHCNCCFIINSHNIVYLTYFLFM